MGDWKAIKPNKQSDYELYDLSTDVEEQHNLAAEQPEILEKMLSYANVAHTPPKEGKVLDPSVGFKGHNID